jgi:crossover junction endodeoxyribonuclease RusA
MIKKFTLPYPPSVNKLWRAYNGRNILSKEGRLYKQIVSLEFSLQNGFSFGNVPISIKMEIQPPDRRKRDIDNIPKIVLDSLQNAGCFDDDSQIVELHLIKKPSQPRQLGMLELIIEEKQIEFQN